MDEQRSIPGRGVRSATAVSLCALTACDFGGSQSALSPAGPEAQAVHQAWWFMLSGATAIWLLVAGLALLALLRRPGPSPLGRPALIVAGGLLLPLVILSVFLVYGFGIGIDFKREPSAEPAALSIEVVGKRWWWEVRYDDPGGGDPIVSANEIHIPAGRSVDFTVSTADVIHSFWVPNLAGKIDMIPGKVNRVRIQADRPGIYRGQCAEYCGTQHALMGFHVVVHSPGEFDDWLANERRKARPPGNPFLERGRDVFMRTGCNACHTIRGTAARGTIGPDLTHIGSRLSLGAATIDNHRENLADWIADSQAFKPGNEMPRFSTLDDATVRAIAAYLESLE